MTKIINGGGGGSLQVLALVLVITRRSSMVGQRFVGALIEILRSHIACSIDWQLIVQFDLIGIDHLVVNNDRHKNV